MSSRSSADKPRKHGHTETTMAGWHKAFTRITHGKVRRNGRKEAQRGLQEYRGA